MSESPSQRPTLETENCLVVFDIHQDLDWVQSILRKEEGRFSHVLLGGDYFDASIGIPYGVEEVSQWLLSLREELGDRLTILLGNHDVQYAEAARDVRMNRSHRILRYPVLGCFTSSRARKICRILEEDFWESCRLFQRVNGFLISHAGLSRFHWPDLDDPAQALAELDATCREMLRQLPLHYYPLLDAGIVRGGNQAVGGITWLDWNDEFQDDLPYPQIVGHTRSAGIPRQKGRSWCLDGSQSCYGMLGSDGTLRVEFV